MKEDRMKREIDMSGGLVWTIYQSVVVKTKFSQKGETQFSG